MSVRHIPCGTFVNESERIAVERLNTKLQSVDSHWVLLSNLNHAQHSRYRSDEIDIVAIGGNGVYVIEVKHWDVAFIRKNPQVAELEADRINAKAKRVAGRLRPRFDVGFVEARLLLTRGSVRFDAAKRTTIRGVSAFGLPEWSELLSVGGTGRLSKDQVELAARTLEPTTKVALSGDLRAFAGLVNLERQSDKGDAFHRVYRGQHPTRRDRVILHMYDLSASDQPKAMEHAEREFQAIQLWQKSPFVPSLLDSFQEADGYPGEIYFYSLVDPSSPTIFERREDESWDINARLAYAIAALEALYQFHTPEDPSLTPILHRRISPRSLRVRHNNLPLFTDFAFARLQDAETISPIEVDFEDLSPFVAEEVRKNGLAVADARSDVYALCASLLMLFETEDPLANNVRSILQPGCSPNPTQRPSLSDLTQMLTAIGNGLSTDEEAMPPPLPAADYWDEDTIVPFQNSRFKILDRLGKGGVGQTFKVVELDAHSDEKFGTYVAKLVREEQDGETAIRAYKQVRAYTTHPNLSTIHEIAPVWKADHFVALMKWVEGMPLEDLTGVLSLYAEDLGEDSAEELVLRWLIEQCSALDELHRVGLIHGDVSPRNLIVQGGDLVLTDYDTVVKVGGDPRGGTIPYSSPTVQNRTGIHPGDDIYALAASLFYVLTDRDPFTHGSERRKDLGLSWDVLEPPETLRSFLDRATHPDPDQRFTDAHSARDFLLSLVGETTSATSTTDSSPKDVRTLTPNQVPWLKHLLSAYPGSRHGNSETRGLDSDFAAQTYVETDLDDLLLQEIRDGSVNLVILFGNAGDGKTAFLQYLAQRLGLHEIHSSRRVWETQLPGGQQLMVNLDGAAAWEGRDANALLDDLFRPFHGANFPRDRIHIVAVNNGKLLEWVESQLEDTWLTASLRQILLGKSVRLEPRFRLIDLNQRSLVGGIDSQKQTLSTDFLETLIDRLLGVETDPWIPCLSCSAQNRCTAWYSVQALRDPVRGAFLRLRLTDLLQACHQRGEIHITARELRASLSYCFFGVDDCADLHDDPDLRPERYWQRVFDARSRQRQGELLAEMTSFDPALEADPGLDRLLLRLQGGPPEPGRLTHARRRAWFEQPDGDTPGEVTLAGGCHLDRFRQLPLMTPEQRDKLLQDICLGIAHLEQLPTIAFSQEYLDQGVPLRITPRTPTESAFWAVKPWERFELRPAPAPIQEGLETLHTHLHLKYQYANGGDEILVLGLELFHLLLELKDGVQLFGVAQEGVFANLEIFTQRLAQEDARDLRGWHPTEEDRIFQVRVVPRGGRQVLVREGS